MADAAWWALHALWSAALLLCVLLAVWAARRVGFATPYGGLVFLLAVGFWFLLGAELLLLARTATGGWRGPGALHDLVGLAGWLLLTSSFALFVLRFPPDEAPSPWRAAARLALWGLAPAFALLALFHLVLSPPGADPAAPMRAASPAADGVAVGMVGAALRGLLRLRRSAIGKLYLLLALAMVLKTTGDLAWAWLAARGAGAVPTTATYALAGALAAAGLLLHTRMLAREPTDRRGFHEPREPAEARMLRDLVVHMRGLAGGFAADVALGAARAELARRGCPARVAGNQLVAEAPPEAWASAFRAARQAYLAALGPAARERLRRVEEAYGSEGAGVAAA